MHDTAPSRSAPMRRDALKRREALLNAAVECFETRGFSVPLEEIADRAGVGRGTLYRNFRDRVALTLAIFEREVERMADEIDLDGPFEDVLRVLVFRGARTAALFSRMAAEVQLDDAQMARFRALGARVETTIAPVAAHARATGRVRGDVGAPHLVMVMRMLGGLIKPLRDPAEADEQFAMALAMLMEGLSPR